MRRRCYQYANIIEEWDRYDKDQSGTISMEEFIVGETAWYASVNQNQKVPTSEMEERLKFWLRTLDKDGNNEVSWWEFANAKALLALDNKGDLHTCLTQCEIDDAQEAFNFIDKDGGGAICESEAREYYTAKYDKDVKNNMRTRKNAQAETDKAVERLFRTHDGDGSGSIEFDEFLKEEARSIISDRSNAENRKQATRVDGMVPAKATAAENPGDIAQVLTESQLEHAKLKFDDLDKDGSGTIEYKELQSCMKSLGVSMSKKEFKKKMSAAFKAADASGDKKLDFEEFKVMYNFIYVSSLDMDAFA